MIRFWQRWKFAICFGLGLVFFQAGLITLFWRSAPLGTKWLGETIDHPSDIAVYLSYLRQGADGSVLLKNLFAIEPHAARFDPFWSSLGLITRLGLSPVLVHELARWICTLILVFAVYAATRALTKEERYARLGTILAFAGISQGWVAWSTSSAPDVTTEFSIPSILFGGAHIIFSLALLMTGLRRTWCAFAEVSPRDAWFAAACVGALFSFHPYFVPLFGCFVILALFQNRQQGWKKFLPLFLPFGIAALPVCLIYVPLAFDRVFRTHHLHDNVLPGAPFTIWFLVLLPFIAAIVWRIAKHIGIKPEERWIITWIISAAFALLLPFPWKRKFTEGLGVALVLLTLPAWSALWDWLRTNSTWSTKLNRGLFLFLASLVPFHLLTSQIAWMSHPSQQQWFYRSNDIFAAWQYLATSTPLESIIVTDDFWINVWTPAYTGRTVWVAHDHETPFFSTKLAEWKELLVTSNATTTRKIIADSHATAILLTRDDTRGRLMPVLMEQDWNIVFQTSSTIVITNSK